MDCNTQIHDELKNMMESTCPFCDQQLVKVDKVDELCCDEQELENYRWYEYMCELWLSSWLCFC